VLVNYGTFATGYVSSNSFCWHSIVTLQHNPAYIYVGRKSFLPKNFLIDWKRKLISDYYLHKNYLPAKGVNWQKPEKKRENVNGLI
jgi:hypothetical protein